MANAQERRIKWKRFFKGTFFSIIVMAILVAILVYIALSVTETYQDNPDFGGMITLRQTEIKKGVVAKPQAPLTRDMILSYITSESVLLPIAVQNEWNVSYQEMLEGIDVRNPLAAQNSFIIIVNTKNPERSRKIAKALTLSFLQHYQTLWAEQTRNELALLHLHVNELQQELDHLKDLKVKFGKDKKAGLLNNEIEAQAINEQLLTAQSQFMSAYGMYIQKLEDRRSEAQLDFDLQSTVKTRKDPSIRILEKQVQEINRQCKLVQERVEKQDINLYQMDIDTPMPENLPSDLQFFYRNIQTLLKLKFTMMVDMFISNKEDELSQERKAITTLERLLENNTSDVFIREI